MFAIMTTFRFTLPYAEAGPTYMRYIIKPTDHSPWGFPGLSDSLEGTAGHYYLCLHGDGDYGVAFLLNPAPEPYTTRWTATPMWGPPVFRLDFTTGKPKGCAGADRATPNCQNPDESPETPPITWIWDTRGEESKNSRRATMTEVNCASWKHQRRDNTSVLGNLYFAFPLRPISYFTLVHRNKMFFASTTTT